MNASRSRILLVEDEFLLLAMMEDALADAGHAIATASDADSAIRVLQNERPATLVTDVNLGRGVPNGWDVARFAREQFPDLPVIYVTGDSAHQWAARGVPNSVLLAKPFATADLVAQVGELLTMQAALIEPPRVRSGSSDRHV